MSDQPQDRVKQGLDALAVIVTQLTVLAEIFRGLNAAAVGACLPVPEDETTYGSEQAENQEAAERQDDPQGEPQDDA